MITRVRPDDKTMLLENVFIKCSNPVGWVEVRECGLKPITLRRRRLTAATHTPHAAAPPLTRQSAATLFPPRKPGSQRPASSRLVRCDAADNTSVGASSAALMAVCTQRIPERNTKIVGRITPAKAGGHPPSFRPVPKSDDAKPHGI